LSETIQIQEEYFNIADHLTSSLSNLHNVLINGVSRKSGNLPARFRRKSSEFEAWLKKEREHVEMWRFQTRTRHLMERIAKERLTSTNASLAITMDLETLIHEVDRKFTNYLADAELVLRNAGIRWDLAQTRLEQAGIRLKELFALAERARANGEAAKSFRASQSEFESIKHLVRQQRALTLLSNSESAMEYITQAGISQSDRLKPFPAASVESPARTGLGESSARPPVPPPLPDPSLRSVRYSLLIALAGLGVFLMAAIYRRMVVAPLGLKLVESETMNKLAHFGRLAAGLAHEIRNPLTAIGARLYTLQKGLAEGSSEFQDASVIRNEMRRLDRIVKDFLTLARPSEPKLVPISAEPLLKKTHDLLAPVFETQSVQLTLGPIAEGQFRGDEEQLRQVLINLSQNAADSMEGKGGPIVLRARKDRAKIKGRETDAIIIEVEDAGPGIPPEIQERLFDPFFSTKEQGTGLGLAIAARIVDKHAGELTFETHLDRGTTFGIVLPLYDKSP
jgi:signal transduction histidine kinase